MSHGRLESACRRARGLGGWAAALLTVAGCAEAPVAETPAVEDPPCPEGAVPDGTGADEDSGQVVCVPEACGAGPWAGGADGDAVAWVAPWGDDGNDGSADSPYRTLLRGLDAAAEQDGGTVELSAGTWEEILVLTDAHDGIVLEGRCPDLTVLDGGDGDEPTVWVQRGRFTLRQLTITGGDRGLGVARNSSGSAPHAVLEDVVIRQSVRLGVLVTGPDVRADLYGVTITDILPLPDGSQGRGIEVNGGGLVYGEGLLVDANRELGIFAGQFGTRIELEDSIVSNTVINSVNGSAYGISLQDGAALVARGLLLESNRGSSLGILTGSTADLEDTRIVRSRPSEVVDTGSGISLSMGGRLVARSLLIEDTQGTGIFAEGAGSSVELEGAQILGVQPRPDGEAGSGLAVQGGASLVATDLRIERAYGVGLTVREQGTTAELHGVVIADILPTDGEVKGQGIAVLDGGVMTATDVELIGTPDVGLLMKDGAAADISGLHIHDSGGTDLCGTGIALAREITFTANDVQVERFCGIGIKVEGPDTVATLADARFSDLFNADTEPDGLAVLAYGGGALTASDVRIERAGRGGLLVWGEGTSADLERVTITDTDPAGTAPIDGLTFGRGVEVGAGSILTAQELTVEDTAGIGVLLAGEGCSATLVDSAVRGTWHSVPGLVPVALHVQTGATVTATRLELSGNQGIGMSLVSEDTSLVLEDSQIRDTAPTAAGSYGMGAEVIDGTLSATDTVFSGNAHLAFLASGSEVTLDDVEIRDVVESHQAGGGSGLGVQGSANVLATGLMVHETTGPGAFVSSGGFLRCEDCSFTDTDFAGLAVLDAEVELVGGSVRSSRPAHSLGGGVGLLAWKAPDLSGRPRVSVDGTVFADHPGPALYLRGSGRYELIDARIEDSATLPGVPGSLIALEGVEPWSAANAMGLLLDGVTFASIPTEAIVLDASSGTLDGNTFTDVAGYDLFRQNCETASPPAVLSGAVSGNDCAGAGYVLDPALWFAPVTDLIVVIE